MFSKGNIDSPDTLLEIKTFTHTVELYFWLWRLASTVIPAEDANAIAERLVHENARLQIQLQQVKDELKAVRSATAPLLSYEKKNKEPRGDYDSSLSEFGSKIS